mgnify:CR=1 FL=1
MAYRVLVMGILITLPVCRCLVPSCLGTGRLSLMILSMIRLHDSMVSLFNLITRIRLSCPLHRVACASLLYLGFG